MPIFREIGWPNSTLRSLGRGEPSQRLAVIPGHPLRWTSLQLLSVPLQLGQIIKCIDAVQGPKLYSTDSVRHA